jgi:uncharacterized membrane protein
MTRGSRLAYVDWMRGLAILIMIEAHVLDAWTRPADRRTLAFACSAILAGFAAPMFLFLAGASVALAAAARARRTGDEAGAAAAVRRRGWQVLGLAYLFRLQAYLLNPKALLAGLLKVDILNIMGPSIVAAAALWQAGRERWKRAALLAAAALAVTLVTPLVRTAAIGWLPDPLEWYVRPVPGRNNFTFFPWAGFVFAGGLIGVLLDAAREPAAERRLHVIMGFGGLVFAGACYAGSYLPSIYADSHFWTSAPSFFLLRTGVVASTLSAVFLWEQRRRVLGRPSWSPMTRLGRSSLFVYWVHVELVYGATTHALHRRVGFGSAVVGVLIVCGAMYALVVAKDEAAARLDAWRRARQVPEVAGTA